MNIEDNIKIIPKREAGGIRVISNLIVVEVDEIENWEKAFVQLLLLSKENPTATLQLKIASKTNHKIKNTCKKFGVNVSFTGTEKWKYSLTFCFNSQGGRITHLVGLFNNDHELDSAKIKFFVEWGVSVQKGKAVIDEFDDEWNFVVKKLSIHQVSKLKKYLDGRESGFIESEMSECICSDENIEKVLSLIQ
jgi:hypothetical protein